MAAAHAKASLSRPVLPSLTSQRRDLRALVVLLDEVLGSKISCLSASKSHDHGKLHDLQQARSYKCSVESSPLAGSRCMLSAISSRHWM